MTRRVSFQCKSWVTFRCNLTQYSSGGAYSRVDCLYASSYPLPQVIAYKQNIESDTERAKHQTAEYFFERKMMTLPNFFIIGAAKAGTSSLHEYFVQHPEVFMSRSKDTAFFSFYNRSIDWNGPGGAALSKRFIGNLSDYQDQFSGARSEIAIGESSPGYLHSSNAVRGISRHIESPKFIVILRHPVDRAYAHFMHGRRDSIEPEISFEHALAMEEERKKNNWGEFWYYKERSFYYEALKTYFDTFGKENVAVYLFEDLQGDASSLMNSLFDFLGVSTAFNTQTQIHHNPSGIPKNRFLHNLFGWNSLPTRISKLVIPKSIRGSFRDFVMKRNLEKDPLDPEMRNRLIEIFQSDIVRTEKLIGRDLSHWLKTR